MTVSLRDLQRVAAHAISDLTHLPGADREDLIQEAMVGLAEALNRYDPERGTLVSLVHIAARRRALDAIKAAGSGKASRLTYSTRVGRDDDGEWQPVIETLTTGVTTEDAAVQRHDLHDALAKIHTLSPLERRALVGTAIGCAHDELGDRKSIDNALQRARRKLAA